jgi:hypothetical protein
MDFMAIGEDEEGTIDDRGNEFDQSAPHEFNQSEIWMAPYSLYGQDADSWRDVGRIYFIREGQNQDQSH